MRRLVTLVCGWRMVAVMTSSTTKYTESYIPAIIVAVTRFKRANNHTFFKYLHNVKETTKLNIQQLTCHNLMDSISLTDTTFFPQKILSFNINDPRWFCQFLDPELCIKELFDLFTHGDLMIDYVRIEVHQFRACIHRQSAVVFFHRIQPFTLDSLKLLPGSGTFFQ